MHRVEPNQRGRRRVRTPPSHRRSADDDGDLVRGDAIQALDHDVLRQRSIQVSGAGFITIISIIQGVALALLADNTFSRPSGLVYAQAAAMLMIFVTVFYFYVTVTIFLRWAPSFLDFFLPFAIAGLEIPPAFFLGDAVKWNGWLGAFWMLTSLGVHQTRLWSPQSHFGNDRIAHGLLHRLLRELQLITAAGGTTAISVAIVGHQAPAYRTWWIIGGVVAMLGTVAMVVARTELRSSQIYGRYGVHRPIFN